MDHYSRILFESAWSASIIPFSSEATLSAMQSFGGFNLPLAVALSVVGATAGMSFNWFLGKMLFRLHQEKKTFNVSEYWYARVAALFNKYGVFLLLLSWLPLLKFVVVIAGFLNTRYRFVLPLVILGHLFSYGFILLKH